MSDSFCKTPKWLRTLLIVVAVGLLVALFATLSWAVTEETFHRTSHEGFCVSCHSMKPFAAAYEEDVHGGRNQFGVQAACTDCHLDKSSSMAYFVTKAKTGMHDFIVENTEDTSKIDWEASRERREEFTYDSGCLSCHENLQDATKSNHKAFLPHKEYFLGTTDKHCVSCHEHVGHKNLSYHIANP